MFPEINPTTTSAWSQLSVHFTSMKNVRIKDLFKKDQERFEKFHIVLENMLFDFSKNNADGETISLLLKLANECKLESAIKAMFDGEKINKTENRAVMHTALRNFSHSEVYIDGQDIMKEINRVRKQMKDFCSHIHSGNWRGFSGKKIKYIVNIGIGEVTLGP